MPSYSIGFWVAITKNGDGSGWRHAVGGHLPFLHRLEQRGLRLRWRAVDLVAEQQVREQRTGAGTRSRCVRWLKIVAPVTSDGMRSGVNCTREKCRPMTLRERTGHERLGEPGVVVDEHVAVGEQPEQHEAQRVALPDDRPLDLVEDRVGVSRVSAIVSVGARRSQLLQRAHERSRGRRRRGPGSVADRVSGASSAGSSSERELGRHRAGQLAYTESGSIAACAPVAAIRSATIAATTGPRWRPGVGGRGRRPPRAGG